MQDASCTSQEVEKNYPMFSRPMSHDEFLAELGGEKAVETTGRGYTP
jgi:ureidoacrylate peracid hydrolase